MVARPSPTWRAGPIASVRSARTPPPWHFVDISLGASGYDATRDCSGGNCVVEQIANFQQVLASSTDVNTTQDEALKFLVHFVGDVHQPLHTENDSDEGGNEVNVTLNGRKSNLHSIWDTAMLVAIDSDAQEFADNLDPAITSDQITSWTSTQPADWANEGLALAESVGYGPLNNCAANSTVKISATYESNAQTTIQMRLSQTGIRLANILNTVFQ
jgi:hypothetical protein